MGNSGVYHETTRRPQIDFVDGKFTHNGTPCRVVMRRSNISIGCSDVTPFALRNLIARYDAEFCVIDLVVVQP